jgi:hypothetical protein
MSTPTRHTFLGELPVDVNTIDQLDEAATFLRERAREAQDRLAATEREAQARLAATGPAVRLAEAYMAMRAACKRGLDDAAPEVRTLRDARKAYKRSMK